MKSSNFLIFLCLVAVGFLTACSHTKEQSQVCQELDWYEIGRQDGTKGLNLAESKKVHTFCEGSDQSLAEALYYNGYDAGAAQYCTAENGYELGRTGQKMNAICPPMIKSEFEKSYAQGARYANLTKENLEIERKLKTIEVTLQNQTLEAARLELLKNEKITLAEKKKALESELQALRESVN